MRRILVDRARRKLALRRGEGAEHVDLDEVEIVAPTPDDGTLIALSDAMDRLAAVDPAKVQLVKLRFFVGLTMQQAAATLGISEPTAKRWWAYAKAWLYREISGPGK